MKRAQMTVTYRGGHTETYYAPREELGTFGSLFRLRREAKLREAQESRASRLVQLDRDIEALEAWHHAWRLEHDVDYRELHPGEWCERHEGLRRSCAGSAYHYRRAAHMEPWEARTLSGAVIRNRPAPRETPELSLEVRRAATRTMANWGRGDAV